MPLSALQQNCLSIIESVSFTDLTTIDINGYPATRALMNLRCKRDFPTLQSIHETENNPLTIFLTTNTGSAKMEDISKNNKASLYFCKPLAFRGVLLQGTVEVITDAELKKRIWQKGWEMYYPKGESDYTILRFIPNKVKSYENFSVNSENI